MTKLNSIQMHNINAGDANSDWCAAISFGIIGISIFNPIAGVASGIMWVAACWALDD